ncbi:MAG: Coenzyme F420 hydrogenase/dehydrogenase, beta subunit C-terminal domain [Methanosarcinales archaeon Met12]|nr:MAG: Coenzyme F420 hydrogenase/dehydrogenase, beta subunit C-terminal domain [Methanosarcinales archaeon Met12]
MKIREVIDAGKCTGCGGCVAVCPIDAVMVKEYAVIGDECTECDVCSMTCPVVDGFPENEFDNVLRVCAGRSDMQGQDGAVVSGILRSLLAGGHIDCAIGVGRDDVWRATPILITDAQDVAKTSGTKYTHAPVLSLVKDAMEKYEKIAIIGVPCQVHSARLLNERKIVAIIGLFCMSSFTHGLCEFISSLGVNVCDVHKMDFDRGKFVVYADEEHRVPIKDVKEYARPSCKHCRDFSAYHADISVGSVGSPEGWSTMLIRTKNGEKLLDLVELEYGDADMDAVKRLSDMKRKTS